MKQSTKLTEKPSCNMPSTGRTKTLSFKVYVSIKEKIISRQFKSDQFLTDKEISSELHISRTPIREALSLLEHEGFLSREDRRGWRVRTLNIDDIKNIYEIKAVLEGFLLRNVAGNIKQESSEKLRQVILEMKEASKTNSIDSWWKADGKMYDLLFEIACNQRLCKMIKDLNDHLYDLRIGVNTLEGRMARSTREHEEIFECLIQGDSDKAELLQIKHTQSVFKELERVLVQFVMPFLGS